MDNLLDDAFELLELATKLEKQSAPIEAATKFYEASYLMKRYLQRLPITPENDQTRQLLREKISHYDKLASTLLNQENNEPSGDGDAGAVGRGSFSEQQPEPPFSKNCQFFDDTSVVPITAPSLPSPRFENVDSSITDKTAQANSRLSHALDLDEAGQSQDAIQEYMKAAEQFLEAIKMTESAGNGADSVVSLLKRRLAAALDRVEELKHPQQQKRAVLQERKVKDREKKEQDSSLSAAEIAILKRSSLIASGLFLPWSDDDALKLSLEAQKPTLTSASPWSDPDGYLKLADKQRARFFKWARPTEICLLRRKQGVTSTLEKPVMIRSVITPYAIAQKFVTDCSFIASLCICAAYERKFNRKLVSSLIYPQGPDGWPMLSPSGKYMVRLWLNGVARQVVVDDYLPIDKFGNLLCSHTKTTKGLELWVCIIEKAYMKLCGGYDFPGSNSGVDLFSLTGWIPERIFFPKNPEKVRDFETPSERAWERLSGASSWGDCLITLSSSSDLDEEMANQVGLVTGHAYAVLSVVQTSNGTRLIQCKNPWAHKSWRGKYSCHDLASWSAPGLCSEVGYDPVLAQKHDDGVFWISWSDVLIYFKNIHLSWNKELFTYQTTVHGFWPLAQGPLDDTFNVGENPQLVMKLSDSAVSSHAVVWILLSRHVCKQEQEGSDATDYLTVHVHRNTEKRQTIWYPGGKSCVLNGAYTNNPHVLIRYDVTDPTDKYLSLVLSQYKKSHDVAYSLSCFCTEPFALTQPLKGLPLSTELRGEWTQDTAGGPPGTATFENNPMWAFRVPAAGAELQMRCSTAKSVTVNVMAVAVDSYGKRIRRITREPIFDSGDYRHCFTVTERKRLRGGVYTLIASTFHPGQVGSFRLIVESSYKLKFEPIQ